MRLVLLDLDGTVIDQNYNLTADVTSLTSVISHCKDSGWLVGLNSDTPLKPLQIWWRKLCLNGPIIAERGAILWLPDGREVLTSNTEDLFTSLREEVIKLLLRIPGSLVIVGDATEFIRNVTHLTGCDSLVVAVNAYRRCSLSFFVRAVNDRGELVKDPVMAKHVVEQISFLAHRYPVLSHGQLDERYCIFIINAPDTDKTKGVRRLLQELPSEEVIMVGDSMSDFIDEPQVKHYAVGNASLEFKAKCERVANRAYTEGVLELLNQL
jgi:hydroxymethylpyrimidine pyrophosphatase-like HAD family hydrolase